jgi:acyl-CoA thioesterase FadM
MKVSADGDSYDIDVVFNKYLRMTQECPDEIFSRSSYVELPKQSLLLVVHALHINFLDIVLRSAVRYIFCFLSAINFIYLPNGRLNFWQALGFADQKLVKLTEIPVNGQSALWHCCIKQLSASEANT